VLGSGQCSRSGAKRDDWKVENIVSRGREEEVREKRVFGANWPASRRVEGVEMKKKNKNKGRRKPAKNWTTGRLVGTGSRLFSPFL